VSSARRGPRARPANVALAATLHDPPAALADLTRRLLPRLAASYRAVAVATSPPTAARVRDLLTQGDAYAGTPAANDRGPLYRLALRAALASGASHVHYLDFDRALHWMAGRPRELAAVLRLVRRHAVLLLGRTPKAHRSHHLPLYATEVLANRLLAEQAGLLGRVDLLVPSFVLERGAAATLLRRSRARDWSIYGEWAALVLAAAPTVAYLECRGLDWETPDRHRRAVRRAGLAAWRRRQETAAEWSLRVAMAGGIVAGFARAVARAPLGGVTLRRLLPRIS
jgi:hypothetical protein